MVILFAAIGGLDAAAISLGMKGGVNAHICNSVNIENGPEWSRGMQGGVGIEFYPSKSNTSLVLGIEGECFFQNARYYSVSPAMPPGAITFTNLVFPLTLKLKGTISPRGEGRGQRPFFLL